MPQTGYRAVALAFPPPALASRVANPRSFYALKFCALKDDPASPRWKLLDSFLTHYTAGRPPWSESELEKLTQHLLDLIAMSIVGPNQQASTSEGSTRAAQQQLPASPSRWLSLREGKRCGNLADP